MRTSDRLSVAATLLLVLGCSPRAPDSSSRSIVPEPFPAVGTVERLDPRLDALVPPDAAMRKVAEGFDWSEGRP